MKVRKVILPAVPAAIGAMVAAQILKAARRPDLPSFPNQDPSGVFGGPQSPKLRIVAVGDSSLTAPGVVDPDNIWIRYAARRLAQDYRVELISLAVGGSKARDVIEGQLAEAVRLEPDVAVVSVGANDALRGVPAEVFRRRLTIIVERLAETGAGVVLFGMGDFGSIPRLPSTLRLWVSRRSRIFDEICREVAVSLPGVVKVFTRGRGSSAFFEDPDLFAGDQFHAGDRGHLLLGKESFEALEAAISLSNHLG
jgi:lysophospholipase L1-like esterase